MLRSETDQSSPLARDLHWISVCEKSVYTILVPEWQKNLNIECTSAHWILLVSAYGSGTTVAIDLNHGKEIDFLPLHRSNSSRLFDDSRHPHRLGEAGLPKGALFWPD